MATDCNRSVNFITRSFYRASNLKELLGSVGHNLQTNELNNIDGDFVELRNYEGDRVTLMHG